MKFLALAALALLLSAACSSSSEAARIVEADNISLRATLSYYQSLDPTMTAQAAVWTEQIATLQADLNQSREQVTRLTVQMNTGAAGAPVAMPTTDPNSFATIATPSPADFSAAVAGAPLQTSSGMIIERVVTARGMNNADGCPVDETNAFSTSDKQVWVIAVVRNYKRGTTFSAQWRGNNLDESYDWTINQNGSRICVHFYYEMSSLAPGNYTVTFSARESNGESVQSLPLPFVVR
jgi:hypothetical protein